MDMQYLNYRPDRLLFTTAGGRDSITMDMKTPNCSIEANLLSLPLHKNPFNLPINLLLPGHLSRKNITSFAQFEVARFRVVTNTEVEKP
jgi:hypothetical protein